MNYTEMTDSEINKAVSKHFKSHVFLNISGDPVSLEPDPAATYTGKDFDEVPFDPCNSWADAGMFIEGHQISLDAIYEGGPRWLSFAGDGGQFRYVDPNPRRAAMIVFLMMQEGK